MKYVPEDEVDTELTEIENELSTQIEALIGRNDRS